MHDITHNFLMMSFVINNSGSTLAHGMRKILSVLDNVNSYIDDLIVHRDDCMTILQLLEELFRHLQQANMTTKLSKCVFGSELVKFQNILLVII